jgi:hypothetical protein
MIEDRIPKRYRHLHAGERWGLVYKLRDEPFFKRFYDVCDFSVYPIGIEGAIEKNDTVFEILVWRLELLRESKKKGKNKLSK